MAALRGVATKGLVGSYREVRGHSAVAMEHEVEMSAVDCAHHLMKGTTKPDESY